MRWDIAPECVSAVILLIIWGYSRRGSPLPSLKNRVFQGCLIVTFLAVSTNILSTLLLMRPDLVPQWLVWGVTTLYFVCTPLMGLAYFLYSAAILCKGQPMLRWVFAGGIAPGALYALLALADPLTGKLFSITPEGGYRQGEWIALTYLLFYAYCAASILLVLRFRRAVERSTRTILLSFPAVAFVVILVQQFYPTVILSGSAAACALLIIYLHLQNKQMSLDSLTGAPNRQELVNLIDLLLFEKRLPTFTVAVLSLRDFKQINSRFGQSVGDLFLKEVCGWLQRLAGEKNVFRFGGDEFAVLIRDGGREEVGRVLGAIRERMALPWRAGNYLRPLSWAMGVVQYPNSADTAEGLAGGIAYAVSQAKRRPGRNICYCGPAMLGEIRRREQVLQAVKRACSQGAFSLRYQPIYDVSSGRFLYAESLMRIEGTPADPVSPAEFIPLAEATGDIVELTYQVLERVCRYLLSLRERGISVEGVHVNFSAVMFGQPGVVERVRRIIGDSGVPFSQIVIEFTETALAETPELVGEFAREMRQMGIRLGLDDFGTGYSNLSSVLALPFDTVKLDKSLVWAAVEQENTAVMVRALTEIFHRMGMRVLAEGVEDEVQNRFVLDCGIELIQGFLYARPLPGEEAAALLAAEPPAR